MSLEEMVSKIDNIIWGPWMLVLLVGTSVYLTIRTSFLPWRNLPYALKSTLSKEARTKKGEGDVSPFSALTTTLAATIGTGNIVGVTTAMVAGGPGALIWMLISACFGLTTMFVECMLAVKYRELNEHGEMAGGPMYTMSKGIPNKRFGRILGWLFALFAVIASFGIGNMTQSNSIASALNETFGVSEKLVGIVVTVAALLIIVGGIKNISKVSSIVVPIMAIFYMVCAMFVIIGNIENVPSGIVDMFTMAFSVKAVSGGALGTITASAVESMRYGIARGVFSNEAGMGSSAITAAAATADNPVKQGYISMTGTFWDTMVVCTITGLAVAASGVLGMTEQKAVGIYEIVGARLMIVANYSEDREIETGDNNDKEDREINVGENADSENKDIKAGENADNENKEIDVGDIADCEDIDVRTKKYNIAMVGDSVVLGTGDDVLTLTPYDGDKKLISCGVEAAIVENGIPYGTWKGDDQNVYHFGRDGSFRYEEPVEGTALTIQAFETVLGSAGGVFVAIGITLFAFATILGWEYNGEKAFEYIIGTYKYNMLYRLVFSYMAYVGATQSLELVWNLSDIANALMVVPNLICLLLLSGEVARDVREFERRKGR